MYKYIYIIYCIYKYIYIYITHTYAIWDEVCPIHPDVKKSNIHQSLWNYHNTFAVTIHFSTSEPAKMDDPAISLYMFSY